MVEGRGSKRKGPGGGPLGREAEPEATAAAPDAVGEELPFEEAYRRLEAAVERLEGGEATLEESLRLLEEGIRMSRICQKRLDHAQARLEQLLEENGRLVAGPLDLADLGGAVEES